MTQKEIASLVAASVAIVVLGYTLLRFAGWVVGSIVDHPVAVVLLSVIAAIGVAVYFSNKTR